MAVLCDISFSVKMEERRSNGFRVKPSFGQVLGYIQEGEPLTLQGQHLHFQSLLSGRLPQCPGAPQRRPAAPHQHQSGGSV